MIARARLGLAVLAAAMILVGCSFDGEPDAEPTVTPETVATPTPEATPHQVSLGEVIWASDVDPESGAPVDDLTSMPTTADRIVAAVRSEALPAGTRIEARWLIDGEHMPGLEPDPVAVEEDRSDGWIFWTLNWESDEPWPIGRIGIEVEVNDEVRVTDEILIVRPNT